MKEILNNEFANLSYNSESNAIIAVWKKPTTSDTYRYVFSVIVESIFQYNADSFINDIYQQGIVDTENRLWLQNEVFPKAYARGLRKVATITPNDVFSRFYEESVKKGVGINSIDLEFQYFHDLIPAQAWIKNQEVPV